MIARQLTPEAGHAIEKLAHAIEYLTDEFVHDGKDLRDDKGRVDAIQTLMQLNRAVYFECPSRPTLADRFENWLNNLADRVFGAPAAAPLAANPWRPHRQR